MPSLLDRVGAEARQLAVRGPKVLQRSMSWLDYAAALETFSVGGNTYVTVIGSGTRNEERIQENFRGLAEGAYKRHGPVFACMLVRMMAFSEARFAFRRIENGRFGAVFGLGSDELSILEKPWRNGTTGALLTKMILDADIGGNAFIARRRGSSRLKRMRPDYVTIVLGCYDDAGTVMEQIQSGDDLDADVVGYIYAPDDGISEPEVLMPDEVAHFAPIPDPTAHYRGMSWLTPIIREIITDQGATTHKLRFFQRGAALQVVVSLDKDVNVDAFDAFVARFRAEHEGSDNAYKTLFLGGGANVNTITSSMRDLDMKALQGVSETRIASAARVHPVVAGFSEGLQGSSLNAGNFKAALRSFTDLTMRPLWREAAGSLAPLVDVPAAAELWYYDGDIAFLRDDAKDLAEIRHLETIALTSLIMQGYEPDAAVQYLLSNDLQSLVGHHTGRLSVQLQPANAGDSSGQPAIDY